MWWCLAIVSLLAVSTEAFTPAPIRWAGLPSRNLYLAPLRSAFPNKVEASPHTLTILDQPSSTPSKLFPSFTATLHNTITWRDKNWCIEASGTRSGATIRVDRCTGGPTQRWNWLPMGRGQKRQLQLQGTNQCIDVIDQNGGMAGAAIELRECENKASEAWKFEEAIPLPTQSPPQHSAVFTSIQNILMSTSVFVLSFSVLFWWLHRQSWSSIKEGVQLWSMRRSGVSLTLPMVMQPSDVRDSVTRISHAAMALSPVSLENDVSRDQDQVSGALPMTANLSNHSSELQVLAASKAEERVTAIRQANRERSVEKAIWELALVETADERNPAMELLVTERMVLGNSDPIDYLEKLPPQLVWPISGETEASSPVLAVMVLAPCSVDKDGGPNGDGMAALTQSRRGVLRTIGIAIAGGCTCGVSSSAAATETCLQSKRIYFQRFPTLFAPLFGDATRKTVRRRIGDSIWALEQNLELGPLQTPLRCVVIRLRDGSLWVHAPLAPTEEFFELVEGCGDGSPHCVAHVVCPTYALEHKVFVKDALRRWPQARLWTSPGQFSFPVQSVPDEFVWGRAVSGVLHGSDASASSSAIPWTDEIEFETLTAGTFRLGGSKVTFFETVFYHLPSRSLIVTDCLARVQLKTPEGLSDPQKLLLVSKRSTADPFPADTTDARQTGWEKTALLVSYFFPEHEELDPEAGFGVVTWTDGWHDNFNALAGRLIVPPVVRTLIYAQDPAKVKRWAEIVAHRWNFNQIVPAHFEAPIEASPKDFARAFAFLKDDNIDAFPADDLARGLKPIADIFTRGDRST